VVKNGEFFLPEFISHHMNLGFAHIFLLDNGSTDRTLDIARSHSCVTVYQSLLPVDKYQGALKRHLATVAAPNGWCLDVDIDEFFDYPLSSEVPLRKLLTYFDKSGFTAMVTQMLDMFSEVPLSEMASSTERPPLTDYHYYDLSEMRREEYLLSSLVASFASSNEPTNALTALFYGGTRKYLYGLDCLLTKHSLFRTSRGLRLFDHVHFVANARLANVSGLLRHYKFAGDVISLAEQNRAAFRATGAGYQDMIDAIRSKPKLRLVRETSKSLSEPAELLESSFLFASPQARHDLRAS